ncbi:Seed maturation protein [Macleaya cordata]|uniref:Seed maturation protein n=1 Tax=Macleaya cordata TaxID=56857 RepID=A0A200Q4U1_MACCD|nr:Seed maturation protein [Macleaya cordata]
MSQQEQPRRPEAHQQTSTQQGQKQPPQSQSREDKAQQGTTTQEQPPQMRQKEPIKYGDLFPVSGELATKPVAPQDAALMQTAENLVLGQTQKGGAAAVMQSAAAPEYCRPAPIAATAPAAALLDQEAVTIGEALEAVAITAGDKPVDQSDAAAIQAAEVRATGMNVTIPGGIAAEAQSAANLNARMTHDEDKTKLSDVLSDATAKLPMDKAVTSEDAEGVISAELRNNPYMATYPGGVAASVAAAARLNQNKQ